MAGAKRYTTLARVMKLAEAIHGRRGVRMVMVLSPGKASGTH
jgi:hypothetical protein